MSGGGGKPPKADPNIGIAAMKSAKLGEDYLGYMKEQAAVTNRWAEEDRTRYKSVFQPLQGSYIAEAAAGPDYAKVDGDVLRAGADASVSFANARGQQDRRMQSMGVNPASGRGMEVSRRASTAEALGTAGIANSTRLASRTMAEGKNDQAKANAINMGAGLAVNPGTSMGLSNGAASSGFSGAMGGYGQQGSLLNTQFNQEMAGYEAKQASNAALWQGVGSVAGLGMSMMSSKEYKEDKKPARGVLETLKKMPVEEWKYKDGIADGGKHIGPYAEDFKAATGKGDGKSIAFQDAIGVTMGAVQELSAKVDKLAGRGVMSGAMSGSGPTPRSIAGAAA
jgi:hypothetical protein